jgi:hypothetical protein
MSFSRDSQFGFQLCILSMPDYGGEVTMNIGRTNVMESYY